MKQSLTLSKYFSLEKLSEGIFAAISNPGTGSWANAGIVDMGEYTIIIDTFATASAAMDLRKTAEHLTGRKASYVINTHHHIDHVHGNQVFNDAIIISTKVTRDHIAIRQPRFVEMVKQHPEYLDHMKTEIQRESNLQKRQELENLLGEYTAIDKEIETSKLTMPTLTFEEKMVFHASNKTAELTTFGGGHSISDSFVYLPNEQILFLADLMHIGHHADFRQGNIDEWIDILEKLKKLEVKILVSGHGGLGTKDELTIMQDYLLTMKKLAVDLFKNGTSVEKVEEIKIPEKYAHYQVPSVFYGALKYLLEKLQN